MAKPSRVRFYGIAPFVDGVQLNRIQALGSSARLTTEDIKELGTINIVEIVDDVPVVDVSLDANENGTNELWGIFTNKGYGCQVVAVPVSGSSTSIGSNQIEVKQGSYYVGAGAGNRIFLPATTLTVPSGSTYIYLTNTVPASAGVGTSLPANAIQIASLASGAVGSGNIRQADITDTRPFYQIKDTDFELAKVDFVVPVRQTSASTQNDRTMYMERVYANNIDLNFQVSGVATANFRLETDNKRWFLNSSASIIEDKLVATSSTTTMPITQTPNQLNNGNYTLKVIKNGNILTEGTDFTINTGTKTITFTTSLAIGDAVTARYVTSASGVFFSPIPATQQPHPELAGGLKEGQIEVYLSDNATNRVTRVQSARISLPLQREQLHELGTLYPYDRPLSLPNTVSLTLEVRDSDLELMARFAGYTNLASVNEIAITDLVKNMSLTVKIYRENDFARVKLPVGHPSKYVIKSYTVPLLIPQNENWDVRVDSDATQTFEFQAHNLTVTDSFSVGSIA